MTDTVIDLNRYRLRTQLRQSVESLRENFALPPLVVPHAGFHLGSFVRIKSTGEVGWISRQDETARGLVLEVRVRGVAMRIGASGVEPHGAA